jgi:hypothetical protein
VAGWDVRCRNRNISSGVRKGDHAVAGDVPSTERFNSTCQTGQGWRINENGCACSPCLDGAQLERCVWVNAIPFVQYDPQSPITQHALIFNTGLPISFPAMVGPLVGVDGMGRTGLVGTPFFSGAPTLFLGFTGVDSGALT